MTKETFSVKEIQAYNFADFCAKAEQAVLDGYRFDLESNQYYPTTFGSHYFVNMLKYEPTDDVSLVSETTTQVESEDSATQKKPRKNSK